MSSPRDRVRDLSLERLDDRDSLRRAYLVPPAHIRTLEEAASTVGRFSAAYQALIDAVFTAPGATEWLNRLRQRVAEIVGGQEPTRHPATSRDAIRPAESATGWF